MYGSHGSKRKAQFNEYHSPRANVALNSLSSEKKSIKGRRVDSSDSQEEILQPEHNQFVVVKHDFVSDAHSPAIVQVTANVVLRPCPTTTSTGHIPSIILTRQCLGPAGLFDRTSSMLYNNILFEISTLFLFLGQQPSMACIGTRALETDGIGGTVIQATSGDGRTSGLAVSRKTDPVLAANSESQDQTTSGFVMDESGFGTLIFSPSQRGRTRGVTRSRLNLLSAGYDWSRSSQSGCCRVSQPAGRQCDVPFDGSPIL